MISPLHRRKEGHEEKHKLVLETNVQKLKETDTVFQHD
jgi:hypothetical protein